MQTYNELYISLRQRLKEKGVEACSLEARLLVAAAADKRPEELMRDLQLYTSPEVEERLSALEKRRLAGEPAAYILGRWEFYGLDLRVTPDVLIPRSDTEVLAETALGLLRGREEEARVLELCAGSGCIGGTSCGKATSCWGRSPRRRWRWQRRTSGKSSACAASAWSWM